MHTGDIVREDEDGFWYIVDRTKDMIVTGGFNVFPREVEDVVAEHPMTAQIQDSVKERKGAVQVPKQVIVADSLPLTGRGKPDKKALRATYWTGERSVG